MDTSSLELRPPPPPFPTADRTAKLESLVGKVATRLRPYMPKNYQHKQSAAPEGSLMQRVEVLEDSMVMLLLAQVRNNFVLARGRQSARVTTSPATRITQITPPVWPFPPSSRSPSATIRLLPSCPVYAAYLLRCADPLSYLWCPAGAGVRAERPRHPKAAARMLLLDVETLRIPTRLSSPLYLTRYYALFYLIS